MSKHVWNYVKPNRIVDIVSPSGAITSSELTSITSLMNSLGLPHRLASNLTVTDIPYYAGSDDVRLEQLMKAFHAEDSDIVWCARGGYGAGRLLPALLKQRRPKQTKLFVGFSDNTAIHIFLNQFWDWPSLHSPVLFQAVRGLVDQTSLQSVQDVLHGKTKEIEYSSLTALNDAARNNRPTSICAPIVGGNLSLIQTSLGTKWQLNPKGKILFLEEVSERGYSIDRMLNHLQQAGLFQQAKAVIFGDIIKGQENDGNDFTSYALTSFAQHLDIPVLQLTGIGHAKINDPLPFNTSATLMLDKQCTLLCATGGK